MSVCRQLPALLLHSDLFVGGESRLDNVMLVDCRQTEVWITKKHRRGWHSRRSNGGCRLVSRPPDLLFTSARATRAESLGREGSEKGKKPLPLLHALPRHWNPLLERARCHFFASLAAGSTIISRGPHTACVYTAQIVYTGTALCKNNAFAAAAAAGRQRNTDTRHSRNLLACTEPTAATKDAAAILNAACILLGHPEVPACRH